MIPFITNNKVYELQANNQISSILAMFDNDYLMDIAEDTMNDMFNQFDILPKPNLIDSLENVFKAYSPNYPNQTDQEAILDTRQDAYNSIIKLIMSKYSSFGVSYQEDDYTDIFTMAYYIYDFFISKFNFYLVDFFARYLYDQKEDLCNNLGLSIYSKNKDTSTNYGKLAFGEDDFMTLITANLPTVLGSIRSLDSIKDDLIYKYAYGNNDNILELMIYHISTQYGIYRIYTEILFNPDLYPSVITQIRLRLQMLYNFNEKNQS